jgi:putative tRNA adenosine deaminase-associated protein
VAAHAPRDGIALAFSTFGLPPIRARIDICRTGLPRREVVGQVAEQGFAVVAFRDGVQWRVEPLPPAVLGDLGVLLSAVRSQPPEGGPFVIACIEDEFFVIARQDGLRTSLLLSDLTAAVEFPLAEQAITRLGEDPPADDELDEVWPVGDLELFSDLGLPEDEMEDILDDLDALPEEMLDTIVERLGIAEQYGAATEAAWAGR